MAPLFRKRVEYERAEILMHYDLQLGFGQAAVQWTTLREYDYLPGALARIALVAALYGRTLSNHAPTRTELFHRVGDAVHGLLEGDDSPRLTEWYIEPGGIPFRVWPWLIISDAETVPEPKVYVATLYTKLKDRPLLHLKMALGMEKILAPSALLIALFAICQELDQVHRKKLGATLLSMNSYYETPENAGRIRLEIRGEALRAALPTLLA